MESLLGSVYNAVDGTCTAQCVPTQVSSSDVTN